MLKKRAAIRDETVPPVIRTVLFSSFIEDSLRCVDRDCSTHPSRLHSLDGGGGLVREHADPRVVCR